MHHPLPCNDRCGAIAEIWRWGFRARTLVSAVLAPFPPPPLFHLIASLEVYLPTLFWLTTDRKNTVFFTTSLRSILYCLLSPSHCSFKIISFSPTLSHHFQWKFFTFIQLVLVKSLKILDLVSNCEIKWEKFSISFRSLRVNKILDLVSRTEHFGCILCTQNAGIYALLLAKFAKVPGLGGGQPNASILPKWVHISLLPFCKTFFSTWEWFWQTKNTW